MDAGFRYVFGPVVSRRLGISLGVDLLPRKTCTLDCIYCECGATTNLVSETAEYVPTHDVISEIDRYLSSYQQQVSCRKLDSITFSGAGEPTLHSGIGEIIGYLKKNYSQYQTAVITNGTLLHLESVRKGLYGADIVMTSFDAANDEIFQAINRPHPSMSVLNMKKGLLEFKKNYRGKIWVEIFIIPDINIKKDHLDKLREFIFLIKPDRIHLNSIDRPGTESWVRPADAKCLAAISSYLENSEIVAAHEVKTAEQKLSPEEIKVRIINAVSRRPCTSTDLSVITGENIKTIDRILEGLVSEGIAKSDIMERGVFFSLV